MLELSPSSAKPAAKSLVSRVTSPLVPRSPPLAETFIAAAHVLVEVISGHTPEARLGKVQDALKPSVMDVVFNTLRRYGRGDFFLGQLMERPLADPSSANERKIHGLLLAALTRLEDRPEDAHTIVDQAVTAVLGLTGAQATRFKGLTNGVLRSFVRRRTELIEAASRDTLATGQHPPWWIARLQQDHPDAWQSILSAGNTHPPMALRVNVHRITSTNFQSTLTAADITSTRLGESALLLEKPLAVDKLPGFSDGLCSVQDAGAQQAAALLDVHAGQRVLDACAAPGGKAGHLLETADIDLLALDADAVRINAIKENFKRLGFSTTRPAEVKIGDARRISSWWDGRPFERILADVPCSASGVVRRHPDAKWLRRETDIGSFANTQAAILEALWQTLAHGGKMLYATCSVFRQENDLQVASFVERHPDAIKLTELQLLPTPEHDGFYYALLQKS